MKKYNISKPEKYFKDNVEKTYWANVGTMTEFVKDDGSLSRIIEIPAIGLKANIFEIKPKEVDDGFNKKEDENFARTQVSNTGLTSEGKPVPDFSQVDNINPEDIPF